MFAAGGPGRHLGGRQITRPFDLSAVAPLPSRRTPRWRHRIGRIDRFGRLQIPELVELAGSPEPLRVRTEEGELVLAHCIAGTSPAVDARHRLTIPAAMRLEWGKRAAVVASLRLDRTYVVAWPAVRLDDVVGATR